MRLKLLFFTLFMILFSGCNTNSTSSSNDLNYEAKFINLDTEGNQIVGAIEINTSADDIADIEVKDFQISLDNCNVKSSFSPTQIENNGIVKFVLNVDNKCIGDKTLIFTALETGKKIDSELEVLKREIKLPISIYLYTQDNSLKLETNQTKIAEIKNSININVNNISNEVANINIVRVSNPTYDNILKMTYSLNLLSRDGKPAEMNGNLDTGLVLNRKVSSNTGMIFENNYQTIFKDLNVDYFASNVSLSDSLLILPNEYKSDPHYLGKWSIRGILDKNTLILDGNISSQETNLTYLIGNNKRVLFNQLLSASVFSKEVNGSEFSLEVSYDPLLSGHTAFIYSTFTNSNLRIGNVKKIKLLPLKLISNLVIYTDNAQGALANECQNDYENKSFSQCEVDTNSSVSFTIHYSMDIGYAVVDAKNVPIDIKKFISTGCIVRINGNYLSNLNKVLTDENGNIKVSIETTKDCSLLYTPDIDYEY